MRCRPGLLLPVLICALPAAALSAVDEKTAEEALKSKGLRKLSASFALPEEGELSKNLRDAELLKKKARDAQKEQDYWEKTVDEKQQLIVAYLQKSRELRAQLPLARTTEAYNKIVGALNELADRIRLLDQDERTERALKDARGAATRSCEEYVEHLLQTRSFYNAAKAKYDALATDAAVAEAVEAYNKATGKAYKSGPSASFLANGRKLAKLEEAVLSESIDISRDSGNLWHVPVTINGKLVPEMIIDTGASIVSLPWKTAVAVDLEPKPEAPTIQCVLADGRTAQAKVVTARTVRVGKFTVENVRCAVMSQELTKAAPLLGLSFLKNFVIKIDAANGKLMMSKLEMSETGGRARAGAAK